MIYLIVKSCCNYKKKYVRYYCKWFNIRRMFHREHPNCRASRVLEPLNGSWTHGPIEYDYQLLKVIRILKIVFRLPSLALQFLALNFVHFGMTYVTAIYKTTPYKSVIRRDCLFNIPTKNIRIQQNIKNSTGFRRKKDKLPHRHKSRGLRVSIPGCDKRTGKLRIIFWN